VIYFSGWCEGGEAKLPGEGKGAIVLSARVSMENRGKKSYNLFGKGGKGHIRESTKNDLESGEQIKPVIP